MCFVESDLPGSVDFMVVAYESETIIIVPKGIGALQKAIIGEFVINTVGKENSSEKVS